MLFFHNFLCWAIRSWWHGVTPGTMSMLWTNCFHICWLSLSGSRGTQDKKISTAFFYHYYYFICPLGTQRVPRPWSKGTLGLLLAPLPTSIPEKQDLAICMCIFLPQNRRSGKAGQPMLTSAHVHSHGTDSINTSEKSKWHKIISEVLGPVKKIQ